jgi:beta-lactamase regulating signal transducer with metallopeptidase domain
MQQSFMEILLTDVVAKAVCWTLVHSLWQGFVAALVAGVVILTTRKSAAVLRYNLLTGDLVLFLAAAVVTFSYELRVDGAALPARVVVVDGVRDATGGVTVHARYDLEAPPMLERTGVFLNEHAGVVVIVWMACLLMQLVRMTGGLYRIHRLRRRRVFLPTACWQDRMSVLMKRLGIEKKVVLLQSGSVTMPVTFGFLKPSILVPLGMLANLPAEQVETILLHELAHIRRSDYLANLLLHIGEAIFFFNPGVRWVAWLIRQEREACCDDLVLAGTRDRDSYFEALIAFGEYAIGKRSMALPLGSGQPDLLWRIRRMLNQENKKLHLMEKTILSFGLMAVLAIGLVSMKGTGGRGVVADPGRPVRTRVLAETMDMVSVGAVVVDTVPAARANGAGSAAKAPVAVLDTAGESIMVDSMSASATSPGPNGVTIQVTATHLSAKNAATMACAVMTIANARSTAEAPLAVVGAPVTTVMVATGAPVAPVTTIATPVAVTVAPVTDIKTRVAAAIAPVTDIKTPVAGVVNAVTGVTGPTPVAEAPEPAVPANANSAYIESIIADLKAKGLIQGDGLLSFRLDGHVLKVNGVRQSAQVYQVFKDKYVKNVKSYYHYSHQGGSTSSSVWISED